MLKSISVIIKPKAGRVMNDFISGKLKYRYSEKLKIYVLHRVAFYKN